MAFSFSDGLFVCGSGVQALYVGYGANLLYTFPADTLKFLFYDAIKQSWHDGAKLSALESAIGGGLSGLRHLLRVAWGKD